METKTSLNFFLAFLAGLASFVSPCLLPLIPAYISFLSGQAVSKPAERKTFSPQVLASALLFVLGFTVIFSTMGASATYLGKLILRNRQILRVIGGSLVVIFGLHLTGLFRLRRLDQERRLPFPRAGGLFRAFLLGSVFALGWTPCVGPILSSILVLAATESTVWRGWLLLTTYSLGLGIPFLITAVIIERATNLFRRLSRHSHLIEVVSGGLLIITGWLIISNRLVFLVPNF
ncbi:MAG: cytochrome c biogenesis protein CcdA [Candidatus Omnitrophica bacterium]|nr:cytochrome c biogenesis protein CcdA [Candidatus Omnitrophota bacterium]